VLQTRVAERTGGNYALALAAVAIISALVIALFMDWGRKPECGDDVILRLDVNVHAVGGQEHRPGKVFFTVFRAAPEAPN